MSLSPPELQHRPIVDEAPSEPVASSQVRRGDLRKRVLALIATVVAGLLVVFVAGPKLLGAATPHLYAGTVLQQSTPAPALDQLHYGDGTAVDLGAFDGEVLLLYFGYTGCPDVCPTALSDVALAFDTLSSSERDRVQLLMISVDPARDDDGVVDEYAGFFHDSFLGATGEPQAVLEASTQYGIFYDIGEPEDPAKPEEYFVDHTSTLMAIDTRGALRVVWSPTVTSAEIADDVRALLS